MSMTESATSVRVATLADAAACAAIRDHWTDAWDWMPRVHPSEDVVRHYRESLFPRCAVWVAGTPVSGFLALEEGSGFVQSLYTRPPGRGAGKALLDAAKEAAAYLQLWAFVANTGARRFYAREGFREVEWSDGDNEEGLPDVRLVWGSAP